MSEALLLSSITKVFFMSLALVWPEGLSSHQFDVTTELGLHNQLKLDIENWLLVGLEYVNRAVALSGKRVQYVQRLSLS